MVGETADETVLVEIEKVPLVLPAATVNEFGSVADVALLERETVIPPVGAAPVRVTVPVAAVPPATLVGLTETDEIDKVTAGVIVRVAVSLLPL